MTFRYPLLYPLKGKPWPGTKLNKPDGGINRACAAAWLLGEGRNLNFFDSSKAALNTKLTDNGGGSQPNPVPVKPGRLGGAAYRVLVPSADFASTINNYTPPTQNLTVNIWIYIRALPPSGNFGIPVSQWNENGNLRSWAMVIFNDGTVHAYSSSNGTNFRQYQSTPTVAAGSWYMLTVQFPASGGNSSIYINGVVVATTTSGDQAYSGLFNTAQPIYIGYSPRFGASGPWGCDGWLEALTIDTRLLTADEVQWMYYNQFGRWQRNTQYRHLKQHFVAGHKRYPQTILM